MMWRFVVVCYLVNVSLMLSMSIEEKRKQRLFYERSSTQQNIYGQLNEAIRENDIAKIQELIIQCEDKDKSSIKYVIVYTAHPNDDLRANNASTYKLASCAKACVGRNALP